MEYIANKLILEPINSGATNYFLAATPAVFTLFRDICLPIFLIIGAGWLFDRKFRLDLDSLVKLNIYLLVPAFIFVRVTQSPLTGDLAFRIIAFTLCVIAAMGFLSWAYAKIRKLPPASRRALQLSTMFYNCGNYGIPLMALAYPDIAALQVFVLMTMNVSTFSLGTLLAASGVTDPDGAPRRRLAVLLRQPSLYAIAIALAVRGLGLSDRVQATFIWEPLVYAERALICIALLTLGVQLSKTKPPRLDASLTWALAQRLLGGPLIALALVPVFGFSGPVAALLILGAGAPTAINTALLAHEFKADARFATAIVFYSTLFSLLTITFILFLLNPS